MNPEIDAEASAAFGGLERSEAPVLLAEDDEIVLRTLSRGLQASGFGVIEARDGNEFWSAVGRLGYLDDNLLAVVTDIRLPFASGIEIAEGVRSCRWRCPIVIMTAYADDAARRSATALGASLLAKPFPLADLLGILHGLRARRNHTGAQRTPD